MREGQDRQESLWRQPQVPERLQEALVNTRFGVTS
jgi:hypothetical protein